MRILFVKSRASSDDSSYRISAIAERLPAMIKKIGHEISTVEPLLSGTALGKSPLAQRLIRLPVNVDGKEHTVEVLETQTEDRVRRFLLKHELFEKTRCLRHADEPALVIGIYNAAVAAFIANFSVPFELCLCDGLQTTMVPVFLRNLHCDKVQAAQCKVGVILNAWHDKADYAIDYVARFGLPNHLAASEGLEFYGKMSMLKGSYLFADYIFLPDNTAAENILKGDDKGLGMEGVLTNRKNILRSAVRGIDFEKYNPEDESELFAKDFGAAKAAAKAEVQKKYGLRTSPSTCLLTFVNKLDQDRGLDLVCEILDDIMDRNAQLLIAGKGDPDFVRAAKEWSEEFKGRIVFIESPLDSEVKKFFAAADIAIFSQNSDSENLSEAVARRYGAVPVARKIHLQSELVGHILRRKLSPKVNAFTFDKYDADDFFEALMDAIDTFENAETWQQLREQARNSVVSLYGSAFALLHSVEN